MPGKSATAISMIAVTPSAPRKYVMKIHAGNSVENQCGSIDMSQSQAHSVTNTAYTTTYAGASLVRAAAVRYWPEVELFTIYAVMALVLIVRPRGLFAAPEARKI